MVDVGSNGRHVTTTSTPLQNNHKKVQLQSTMNSTNVSGGSGIDITMSVEMDIMQQPPGGEIT